MLETSMEFSEMVPTLPRDIGLSTEHSRILVVINSKTGTYEIISSARGLFGFLEHK